MHGFIRVLRGSLKWVTVIPKRIPVCIVRNKRSESYLGRVTSFSRAPSGRLRFEGAKEVGRAERETDRQSETRERELTKHGVEEEELCIRVRSSQVEGERMKEKERGRKREKKSPLSPGVASLLVEPRPP